MTTDNWNSHSVYQSKGNVKRLHKFYAALVKEKL